MPEEPYEPPELPDLPLAPIEDHQPPPDLPPDDGTPEPGQGQEYPPDPPEVDPDE